MKICNSLINFFLLIIMLFGFLNQGCRKDPIITDSGAKLEFNTDTILFDTVFTTIGSTTRNFVAYNNHNKRIRISSLKLAGGQGSRFRLNVDGVPGKIFTDIEIDANDSIYIFVEVTIDPNSASTPFIVEDSILFETNGNRQMIALIAWGQNAYFHFNQTGKPVNIFGFECDFCFSVCNETWQNDKPHIIYGYAVVDSACELNIPAGVKIHFYNNSGMLVYKEASLKVKGVLGNPVRFQGFRLDQSYTDFPGQWDRIWLMAGSKNNEIDYAIIKNGSIGIQADTVINSSPTLILSNSIVKNMTAAALYGRGATIEGFNNVFSEAGQFLAALTLGGSYRFDHCTFGNFWQHNSRQTPSLVLNNYFTDINGGLQIRDLKKAEFNNCIIYGSNSTELGFDFKTGMQSFLFNHCLLKVDGSVNTTTPNYVNIIKNSNPKFKNTAEGNFELDTLSAAKDKGSVPIGLIFPFDIKGTDRTQTPDLGAYERVE